MATLTLTVPVEEDVLAAAGQSYGSVELLQERLEAAALHTVTQAALGYVAQFGATLSTTWQTGQHASRTGILHGLQLLAQQFPPPPPPPGPPGYDPTATGAPGGSDIADHPMPEA